MSRDRVSPARQPARTLIRLALGLALQFTLWPLTAQAQNTPQMNLPRVTLGAGMYLIQAQVATTSQQQEIGLMFRQDMPTNEGMLFVFDDNSVKCFWMKNTRLPLTAAFIGDDGTIANLADMAPQTTNSHCSVKPVRYVLEMNQGWFARRGIQAGQRLTGAPFTPAR